MTPEKESALERMSDPGYAGCMSSYVIADVSHNALVTIKQLRKQNERLKEIIDEFRSNQGDHLRHVQKLREEIERLRQNLKEARIIARHLNAVRIGKEVPGLDYWYRSQYRWLYEIEDPVAER